MMVSKNEKSIGRIRLMDDTGIFPSLHGSGIKPNEKWV